MQRRKFLRSVAAGGAALSVAACSTGAPEQPAAQSGAPQAQAQAPAQGQAQPGVRSLQCGGPSRLLSPELQCLLRRLS